MGTASELLKKIQAIDMDKEVEDAFNENAFYAEDLNVAQLRKGQGGNGVMPDYSPSSVNDFGKPPGPIRLYETGDFYAGITYKANGDRIEAFSTDKKGDFLEAEYADKAPIKLNPDSRRELNSLIQPTLVENIKRKTGLS